MKTLLLERSTWDLALDRSGNIAVASEPYSVLQDVCSAIRVFQGECYYDTSKGIPYYSMILGKNQSVPVFQRLAEQAAMTVPLVSGATCVVANLGADRRLSGVIQITLTTGETLDVPF